MKNENTFAAAGSTDTKQAWTAPTLTNLSLALETAAMSSFPGMDGGTFFLT